MIEHIKKITEPLARRIALVASRCTLTIVNDKTQTQSAQSEFFEGEVHDHAEVWQQYGFSSVPPRGSEGVALFIGGERINPLIIATENKEKRINGLEEGEAVFYASKENKFHLKNDDSANLKTKKFNVQAGKISFKNETAELIELLSMICDLLSKDKVNTSLGLQPLLFAQQYSEIKNKLDSFKG